MIRQGTTNKCNYLLSAGSVAGTIGSYNFDGGTNRSTWNGSSSLKGQFNCSQTTNSTFNAFVWGVGGTPQTSSCRATVSKLPSPACQLSAQRRPRTAVCDLTLTGSGVIDTSKAPALTPFGSGRWTGNQWKGTGACPMNKTTTFSAAIYGPGGSQASCISNVIPRL